jgi:hypothetical protein
MKTQQRMRVALSVACLVGTLASTEAQAVRLGFENLPHDQELQGVDQVVQAKGYMLWYEPALGDQFKQFMVVGKTWRYNGRSAALSSPGCASYATLSSETNLPFTLRSIDLAPLNGDPGGAVTFHAVKADLSQLWFSFVLSADTTWKTYKFPETFTNLIGVNWIQGDCRAINPPHMFDNIRVHTTAAPEPEDD